MQKNNKKSINKQKWKAWAVKALWIWLLVVSIILIGVGISLDIWSRVLYTAIPLAKRVMTTQMWILTGVGTGLFLLGIVGTFAFAGYKKYNCKCKCQIKEN